MISSKPFIQFDQVIKTYGDQRAVDSVSLDIAQGELLVILGSSGSGKSTLLKMINRLETPSQGRVLVEGKAVTDQEPVSLRRSIGYVFQAIGLFPHMSVAENITIGLRLTGQPWEHRQQRAHELLQLMQLEPESYANRYPEQLSGGEQQRVGVARALATEPNCLLMDEPFAALDVVTRDALQQQLLALKQQLNKTILFVTHDIFEAITLADRIAVMHRGRLEQVGSVSEVVNRPATDFVELLFAKPAKQLQQLQSQQD